MTATATARRVTPTAVQILPADAPEELWLAERRKGIGSSDVAKILGVADRQQAIHVFHDKRGTLTDDDAGEAALWGRLHEDTVAQEWCRRNKSVIRRVGLVAHEEHRWRLTTLDRLVRACPLDRDQKARCALEVKTRSAFKSAKWHKDIPDDVLSQAMWQLIVTGLDHIHVAVLIGGNDYRQAVVRDDRSVRHLLNRDVTAFWFGNVKAGIEPAWNFDADHPEDLLDLDKRLHPEKVGELDLNGIGEVMEYADLSKMAGAAEKARKAAAARLAQIAEGHQYLKFGGELAYHYRPGSRSNCDLERLAERWPDAYADTVTETTFYSIQLANSLRKGKR